MISGVKSHSKPIFKGSRNIMKTFLTFLFFISISFLSWSAEIKLSTVSIEVPNQVTKGNRTIVSKDGVSTYSFTRLRSDSTAFVYSYSFKYGKALYEFRETCKADIWEWLESSYKPVTSRKREFKHFKIEQFENMENPLLDMKMQRFRIEYEDGLRKLTLIYKIDETTQFMASVKSAFPAKDFLKSQDTLISILETATHQLPVPYKGSEFTQSGSIENRIQHHLINLPLALSVDFDNPVVEVTRDDKIIVAFAHSDGSEIFMLSKEGQLLSHSHYSRLIHDIKAIQDGFFALSSDDYNLLRYDIYPSLYLTKHRSDGSLVFTQSFMKKDNTKIPGNQTFDFYSRDNSCLEIADSIGIVYSTTEKKIGFGKTVQQGAYKTFSVQTGFLKKGKKDPWHVSHCFAQKSVQYKNHAYLFSIGDNAPRGLSVSKVDLTIHKDSTDSTSFWHEVLLPIRGVLGDNYVADSHISDPIVWKDHLYIAIETEENAKTNHDSNPRSSNRGMNDIFIVKCDLNGENVKIQQLTKTKHIEETNPKIAVLGDEIFMIYNEFKYQKNGLVQEINEKYLFLDERLIRTSKAQTLQSHYALEPITTSKMPDSGINRDGNEFVKLSDGSIVWLRLMKNTRQFELIVIN